MLAASNHPVHLIKKDGRLSSSAFIPFCDFGGNMSSMGIKTDLFTLPVCNSFQPKVLNDQLCYEADLDKMNDKKNMENELKSGFSFIMDYNEDRQVTFDADVTPIEKDSLMTKIVKSNDNQQAFIHLNTIGGYFQVYIILQVDIS